MCRLYLTYHITEIFVMYLDLRCKIKTPVQIEKNTYNHDNADFVEAYESPLLMCADKIDEF